MTVTRDDVLSLIHKEWGDTKLDGLFALVINELEKIQQPLTFVEFVELFVKHIKLDELSSELILNDYLPMTPAALMWRLREEGKGWLQPVFDLLVHFYQKKESMRTEDDEYTEIVEAYLMPKLQLLK